MSSCGHSACSQFYIDTGKDICVNDYPPNWTAHPEEKTSEQLAGALYVIEGLMLAYAKGEANGGSMDWEDLDSVFEAAKESFPGLYEIIQIEIEPEEATDDDEEE